MVTPAFDAALADLRLSEDCYIAATFRLFTPRERDIVLAVVRAIEAESTETQRLISAGILAPRETT